MGNQSDLRQAQDRTELKLGNLEPGLLDWEDVWVANRPSCRTQ